MKPFTFDAGAGDEQDEYLRATLRKAGLPETLEVAEMRLEYGDAMICGGMATDVCGPWETREKAKEEADDWDGPPRVVVVREVITLAWREVAP